ncbi:methyl-accepting chemotaxis protein [uncultured Desulfovibrio sp.]|uniref:HAMP domain-containing methyl-accepting chemotaxis protein n=1 Tax=uncultured Desulfovibrio sp. TaxID=167968 RepID=UPI002606FC53|nr:methyl-accepting chemotaxis protein [uncultured Desulfovibrio sp.]
MRLTLAKKIGGSFAILLLFTGIISYMAARAMSEGSTVSESMASDVIPKLTIFNSMQGNLLLAAMQVRVFFETADPQSYAQGQKYLEASQQKFKELQELNTKFPTPEGTLFIQKYATLLDKYAESIASGFAVQEQAEKAIQGMLEGAANAQQMFGKLIATMGETQRGFLADGNVSAAVQYSHNLVQASVFLRLLESIQSELLLANRRHDTKAFAAQLDALTAIRREAQNIRANLLREECRDMFDETQKALDGFTKQANEMIRLQLKRVELGQVRIQRYQEAYRELEKSSIRLSSRAIDTVTRTNTILSSSLRMLIIACVVLLVIGAAFSSIITRMITRPVTRTQTFARAVAQGNLDQELDIFRKDEIGMLADDLRTMVSTLKQYIVDANHKTEEADKATARAHEATQQAQEAAQFAENARREGMISAATDLERHVEIISSAAVELEAQIGHSADNAVNAARSLQEVASAMTEMTASIQEVARNAARASEMSAKTRENADDGKEKVRLSLESAQALRNLSLTLKHNMGDLQEKTDAISQIMGVISDIADQTNLLALNAAIEAARAGEAGRGFAVVADEVRKLAEKTMISTADVGKATTAIAKSMHESMDAVDSAVAQVEKSTELAAQAEEALEKIVTEAEFSANEIRSIATACEEQSATSEAIDQSIQNVNSMATGSTDAMSQCSQAVSELAKQSQELDSLVRTMKAG